MGRGSSGGGGGGFRGGSRGGGGRGFSGSRSGGSSGFRSSAPRSTGPRRSPGGNPPPGRHMGPRPGYHGAPPPPPPRRRYYGGGYRRSSGCGSFAAVLLLLIIFVIIIAVQSCSSVFGTEKQINDDTVADNCKEYYEKNFEDRGDVFLLYITYSYKLEEEYYYVWYGASCTRFAEESLDDFNELYWYYYDDDLGKQLANTLRDYTEQLTQINADKVEGKSFKSKCYDDNLGWIDSSNKLSEAAEELHDATGIQFFVVTVNYDKLDGAKTDNTVVWVVVIVAAAVVILVYMILRYSKKKKELKNQEMEQQIKILNTPLEEFGTSDDIDNLTKKYDESDSSKDPEN